MVLFSAVADLFAHFALIRRLKKGVRGIQSVLTTILTLTAGRIRKLSLG
jgi:hypothetical protein